MLLTRDKRFYKTLILLAIPMVLQNLVTFSVGLADNLMIGKLGDSAVSGVYMGNQIQTVLQVLSTGIEGGILMLSAQYWGIRDSVSIRKISAIGMHFAFSVGAVFTTVCAIIPRQVIMIFTSEPDVIEYGAAYLQFACWSFVFFCITQALIASMRSVKSASIGLIVSLISLVINVSLNYILINGKLGFPVLGVKGAAIATLIARISETAVIIIYVEFIDKKLKLKFTDFLHSDKALLKDFLKYGMPIIAGQLVWGSNLLANSMILGRFSTEVITATSLANTVNSLMYVCMNGLSAAVGIIIGNLVGAGDIKKIHEYSKTVQLLFFGLGLLNGLVFLLIRDPFISLYDITPEAAEFSRQFISVLCFTSIGTCYECGCLFGLVKSGGDVSFVFINDTVFVYGVVIPSSIIAFVCGAPAWVVYLLLKCDQVLKCPVAFFKIRKYNWMKNLTRKRDSEE